MKVTTWHNLGPDHYFAGYDPSDPMVPVHSYSTDSTDVEAELRRAVDLFNKDMEWLEGEDREIAAGYRFRDLRSFSKGDGFGVLLADGGPIQFWVSNGRRIIPHDGLFPVLANHGDELSRPLGHLVGYRLTSDAVMREGFFECDRLTAQAAVALHHGVAPQSVVIERICRG